MFKFNSFVTTEEFGKLFHEHPFLKDILGKILNTAQKSEFLFKLFHHRGSSLCEYKDIIHPYYCLQF